jgi:hypothetical protein
MAMLEPGGTILKMIYEYNTSSGRWEYTAYINDATTDPPSTVIMTGDKVAGSTAGADIQDDLADDWAAAHP